MKEHILSHYSKKMEVLLDDVLSAFYKGKTTYETSTIESTDADEFVLKGMTTITKSIEDSDADSYVELSTKETRSIETSDDDSMIACHGTKLTFTIEDSDSDELILN